MKKIMFFTLLLLTLAVSAYNGINYKIISTISNKVQPTPVSITIKSKNIDALIKYSLNATTNRLEFSLKSKNNADVSKLEIARKAHCVGYSRYFAAVFSAALQKNGVTHYKISHIRAKIDVLGINVHRFFNSPAFKDHDLCLITNIKTGEKIFVDPSLSEFLGDVIVKQ